ncbi:recombinase family protein [Paramagnetospirillum marisnigri]|uniref:recombinase family protein n=1 Tax=Paramagnetospirillum marisnigri TaxID=1285242 RepID=UPI0038993F7C
MSFANGAPTRPLRAVIYARYSSDNQSESSIDDQVRECRAYAERLGWSVVQVYADPEISGRSAFRPEYQRMLADAERHRFDVVVCEGVDRLSRRLADLAGMYDILAAEGIRIHALHSGEITDMHVSMLGLVAQQFSKDLGHKTRRGQAGRIAKGKVAGGLAYGYQALPPTKNGKTTEAGEREIVEEEAEVVRRIFTMYASGITPEEIAARLNREGVPGFKGHPWRNTTLRGQGKRGTGILRNELYVGRLVWGRTSFIRLPKTGKRVARINDQSRVQITEVPHLRIISDDLWNAVQAQLEDRGRRANSARTDDADRSLDLNANHRPRYLLTGLLTCSECGGSYIIIGKDRYGCNNRKRGTGMCTNSITITRQKVEERILACLRHSLMAPERVQTFMAEMQQQIKTARRDATAKQSALRKRLGETAKAITHMVDMVEAGTAPQSILERLREREAEKAQIEAELAQQHDDSVIVLMPNLAEVYATKVAALAESLNDPEIKAEATELIRQLIGRVVMTPDPDAPDGMRMEVHGILGEIVALAAGQELKSKLPDLGGPGSQLSVVAGAGFEPATFRL